MNVIIRWSRVATKCNYCSQPIVKDTPVLVWSVKWSNWRKSFYFHPHCWVEDREWHLGNTPKPVDNRGRPSKTICEGDRKLRKVLINKYNRLKLGDKPILDKQRLEIKAKLVYLGGIPPSWS